MRSPLAEEVLRRVEEMRGRIIPGNIHVTITRHYGETAKEKSDELLLHMFIAVFSVTVLIGSPWAEGRRALWPSPSRSPWP